MIVRTAGQLGGQGMGLELTDAAKDHLAATGYDPTMGARPLRRAIQRLLEDPLSERLLLKEFRAGEIIIVDVEPDPLNEGGLIVVFPGHRGVRAAPARARADRWRGPLLGSRSGLPPGEGCGLESWPVGAGL